MGYDFTPDPAYAVSWIVYINGVEVPAVNVTVTYGVWAIPEAQITMVPDPILQRLGNEDRVSAQVFYCDYWTNPGNPEFCLMFDGEIVGWSYVNVSKGRAIVFNCVDYIQIFTQLFFFFMSSISDIAIGESGKQAGYLANGVTLAGFGALYPYSLFAQGLTGQGSPQSGTADGAANDQVLPYITRPIDFVYNVIRALISEVPNPSVPAANFFGPWAKRTQFHKRFLALPYLEDSEDPGTFPILRAVRADQAMAAVGQLASSVGSAGSIWQLLEEVLKTLTMELVMLPTAPAVSCDYSTLEVRGLPTQQPNPLNPVVLGNYFTKPEMLFGLPPSCNVFFPSQIAHYSYEENYITQPTRMYFNDESWTSFLKTDTNVDAGFATMVRDALAVAHPEEVAIAARLEQNAPNPSAKNLLVYPEEFFKGPVVDRRTLPRWFMFLANAFKGGTNEATPAPDPDVNRDVAPGDTDRNLFRLFAKHEFYKERYSRRSGAVELAFNPYPVPGFPCAVFDRRSTQVDVMAYITQVRQTLSSSGWSTSVSFTYGRTMQEMFGLLSRQFEMENQTIQDQIADTRTRVTEGTTDSPEAPQQNRAEPVGAIATAPPETLREIRDVVQNFVRAKSFYESLFHRVPATAADTLTAEQINLASDRSTGVSVNPDTVTSALGLGQSVVADQTTQERIFVPLSNPTGTGEAPLKSSVFEYHRLIDIVSPEGERTGISLQGVDATARRRMLEVISEMRNGAVTAENLEFLWASTGWDPIEEFANTDQNISPNPNITSQLNDLELHVRSLTTTTNLTSDKLIVPKEAASGLFESYTAAMQYGSRPICTLNEYIAFLGGDADPVGRVEPGSSLARNDPRTFAAPYYLSLRTYIPGPPPLIPESDITNTESISMPDGTVTATPVPVETQQGQPVIQQLPPGFPENRSDWSTILRKYRSNVLTKLAPNR